MSASGIPAPGLAGNNRGQPTNARRLTRAVVCAVVGAAGVAGVQPVRRFCALPASGQSVGATSGTSTALSPLLDPVEDGQRAPSASAGCETEGVGFVSTAAATARVRPNVKELTLRERRTFTDAVLALKATPSPYDKRYNYYDQFVVWHKSLSRCDPGDPFIDRQMTGHAGPMFLPWHRQLLLMFENALRPVSRTAVTVPYWDWTDRRSTAAVYAEDFMGGDGDPDQDYAVTTGPFHKGTWQLTVHPEGLEWSGFATPYVTRRLGTFSGIALPTEAELESLFATPLYDIRPFDDRSDPERSFRSALEGWPRRLPTGEVVCAPDGWFAALPVVAGHEMHNAVHLWAGGNTAASDAGIRLGTMAVVPTSPNDPVFWLNHANVDRLWAQWQERHGVDTYEPRAGVAHNSSDDVIRPFDSYGVVVTPRDLADIDDLGYRYSAVTAPSRVHGAARQEAAAFGTPTGSYGSFSCELEG